jgi:nudix-type nucleoside diphosphatase (YffH/AdpP family)
MPEKVEIIEQREVFSRYIFRVEETKLRYEKYDGSMSEEVALLNFDRGDSAAAVIHNTDDDTIMLVEQFRYPAYERGTGWLIELPAGMIRDSERPEDTMRRELVEEIGYTVLRLHAIHTFFVSPGGTSEQIHLFYARVQSAFKTGEGGGVDTENEDIRTLHVPLSSIPIMLETPGQFADAKTLIGLQWLVMNKDNLHLF